MRTETTRSEGGYTLIEMLIAVVLLGLTVTGVLGALAATVFASDVHRKQADAGSVLISASEAVKDPTRNPYKDCAANGSVSPADATHYDATAGVTLPAGWAATAITITNVQYWDGGTAFGATCNDAAGLHMQLVTLQVTDPSARATLSLDVVKRSQ